MDCWLYYTTLIIKLFFYKGQNLKFSEFDIPENIMKGIDALGYTEMTPVQSETFPHIAKGTDLIVVAETGSGKTAACAVPLVKHADNNIDAIQGLVIVPTRELAVQYVDTIGDIAKYTDIKSFSVYGGFDIKIQKAKLTHGVHILVATPGRLIDLLYNSELSLSKVNTLILDEADEMMNMGFIDDIEFIMSCLIHEHQTLLFSATMPEDIRKLSKKYLNNPNELHLNKDQVAPQSLAHCFTQCGFRNRLTKVKEYLAKQNPAQAILFCNSRNGANQLFKDLKSIHKEDIDIIHGGMEQQKRTSLFNRFRKGKLKLVVATDVASRGLDFSHVTHVINFDFPSSLEAYTHRTGRTARMGRKGTALTYFSQGNLHELQAIIKKINIKPIWEGCHEPDFKNAKKPKGRRPYRKKK